MIDLKFENQFCKNESMSTVSVFKSCFNFYFTTLKNDNNLTFTVTTSASSFMDKIWSSGGLGNDGGGGLIREDLIFGSSADKNGSSTYV